MCRKFRNGVYTRSDFQSTLHPRTALSRVKRLKSEDETRKLLERMRPLTDNKLHTLMLTHNVTSKFIHSLRTSLPDHTSISHFQAIDQLIQNAFLDRALPDWQHNATTSPEDFRCMAQQPASDQQHAGFGIGGLADAFGAHYYTTILKCLQDFNNTAGRSLIQLRQISCQKCLYFY